MTPPSRLPSRRSSRRSSRPRTRLAALGASVAAACATALTLGAAPAPADPAPTAGEATAAAARPAGADASAGFVQRDGHRLELDGKRFRFAGTNQYYLMYADPVMTDAVLEKAADNGFDVLRAWGYYDLGRPGEPGGDDKGVHFQYWEEAAGRPAYNDGPDGLQRLDYVVARAKAEGVRLVLPLTNNWANFGGMDQYNTWAGARFHSDFYTDPAMRRWYRDWTTHLLNRVNVYTGVAYKDDPTILAWELANEPRCGGSGGFPRDPACDSDTLTRWVEEMSAHLKSIDPHHLVGVGDEGFLCDRPGSDDWTRSCADGVDSARFAAVPTVDYLSYHLYPDHWGTDAAWGTDWIELHNRIARRVGKPAVLGEFGWQGKADRNVVYRDWTEAFERSGGTGALYWLLSDVREDGTLYPDYDGFTVYCPSPVCTLLSNFAETMTAGRRQFAPVADDDAAQTEAGTPVEVDPLANDVAYQGVLEPGTVDLDPAAAGRQTAVDVAGGGYEVDDAGRLAFVPADGFSGRATVRYVVADSPGRLSGPATVTVLVKPSPQAPQTLFDFADGAQGWSGAGTVTATGGQLAVDSSNGWFGAPLAEPVDLSTRTQLRVDLVSTTGAGPILALQVGDSWTWCQPSPLPWTTEPHTDEGALVFDLTTLDATCTAGLTDVRAVNLFLNAGRHVIDDVEVR